MKIVGPTIVRPWRERIDGADDAAPRRATLLDELCRFRVLDPACGCGNFLYVAYRELRRLEHELKERDQQLCRARPACLAPTGPMALLPAAQPPRHRHRALARVQIARVTLWMGHRQMIDRYGEAEPPLPLQTCPASGRRTRCASPWPETDCDHRQPAVPRRSQYLRGLLGDDYVEWLQRRVRVGVKDLCVYWFRRAADHLQPGQRAGLVGTNSISQNRPVGVSLDYVVENDGA